MSSVILCRTPYIVNVFVIVTVDVWLINGLSPFTELCCLQNGQHFSQSMSELTAFIGICHIVC